MHIFAALERREREGRSVRVAIVGTGFMGQGLLRQIRLIHGMAVVCVANRTLEKAVDALRGTGLEPGAIAICDDPVGAQQAIARGQTVVTRDLLLAAAIPDVDVIMEATGNVGVGASVAIAAIAHGKHIVAANPECQATVGALIERRAEEACVVYSDIDGDQPGLLMNLYAYCTGLGLEAVVAGNCKGVLKRYATPATQVRFATENGISPWIATAAADGTKLNLEMAIVSNATGMLPARRGMTGFTTSVQTLIEDFGKAGLLSRGPIVEYTFGIDSGVFIVARSDDDALQREWRYLKMGNGPHYLFYEPRVLCHFDAPLSAAQAALYGTPTIAPKGAPLTEVVACAKTGLEAGTRLDGIGGFNCYGEILCVRDAEGLLPVGLAEGAVLTRDVAIDQPIELDAVEFVDDTLPLRLRREQDALFAPKAVVPA